MITICPSCSKSQEVSDTKKNSRVYCDGWMDARHSLWLMKQKSVPDAGILSIPTIAANAETATKFLS